MPNMIKVWPWVQAPNKFKKLSMMKNESWLAYVPGEYKEILDNTPWIMAIDSRSEPQMTQLDNGDWIYIGGHMHDRTN
jgi:hypothetical protein